MTTFPGASRAVLLALALAAAPLGAQTPTVDVGHTPAESPYRDVLWKQETTVFSGYYSAASDPAGPMPASTSVTGPSPYRIA